MGIPRLKGHLLRYEEAVWLGQSAAPQTQGNTRNVTSVVIDGPALVYHVYYCIMATMEQHLNPFSAQPSSNEVSVGVMKMLLHLRSIGVNVYVTHLLVIRYVIITNICCLTYVQRENLF